MSGTSYRVIAGRAVLVGKQPDGDSVRFLPDDAALLTGLENGDRVRISADGSVQLRFDGIDAPELHYQGAEQPLGAVGRDLLLQRLGFTSVEFAADGETVLTATPAAVPLVVLAQLVEVNGRPVSVVFAGAGTDPSVLTPGDRVELTPALLAQSVNVWEAMTGVAYPLLYTSTTAELRDVFRAAARTARQTRQGVWAQDSTASFPVTDLAAIGPDGALVWPKLFRRAVDYLRQRAAGQTLPDWLAATPLQDDDLYLTPASEGTPLPLHTVLKQTGQQVVFPVDPIEVTVVER